MSIDKMVLTTYPPSCSLGRDCDALSRLSRLHRVSSWPSPGIWNLVRLPWITAQCVAVSPLLIVLPKSHHAKDHGIWESWSRGARSAIRKCSGRHVTTHRTQSRLRAKQIRETKARVCATIDLDSSITILGYMQTTSSGSLPIIHSVRYKCFHGHFKCHPRCL